MKIYNIDIYINDIRKLWGDYNPNKISESLASYIIGECKGVPLNYNITISINTPFELKEEEQKEIRLYIQNYFKDHINEINITSKYETIKKIILTVLGTLAILFSDYLSKITKVLLPELFLIVGWVSIWEVIYSILFIGNKNKILKKRYNKLLKSKIIFKDGAY